MALYLSRFSYTNDGMKGLLKGRRGETRLVALVAAEDHVPVDISAEGRIRVTGRRVKTPLEDVCAARSARRG